MGATVVLRTLTVDGRVADQAFADAADWRLRMLGERREESAEITVAAGGGVEVSFLSGVSDTPAIIHADVPAAVPVVITTATDPERLEQATALSSPVPGGEQIVLTEVGRSDALPVVGRHGVMLDLDLARLFTGEEAIGFRYHVWLGPNAPPSIIRDLEQHGLDVLRVRTMAEREADLGEQARKVRSQAARALEGMGLTDLSDRLVEQLSGGQRQRVAVARALVTTPALILADEPTAELDAVNRDRVVAELRAEADRGAVVIVGTHDPDVAARFDDELHLADGVVAEPT
ncbi:MAG: ATP-binding cassette domain-containing protein [Jiangellaceae bacterium]